MLLGTHGGLFKSENRQKKRTNLMVFLRPIVMRDAEATNKLSLDRYELMRMQQLSAQPVPSTAVPVNEAPSLPPAKVLRNAPGVATPGTPLR